MSELLHVRVGKNAEPSQQDYGGTCEDKTNGEAPFGSKDAFGYLSPHPTMRELIAKSLRGLVQAFSQQSFALVMRCLEPLHVTILLADFTISARA
jgi:hypothetical protein